jgi:hypothetical protein
MPDLDFSSILSDSSRSLADYTAAVVGDNAELFREVLDLAYQQRSPLSIRAARVADLCCERHPELVRPYLNDMVRNLPMLRDMSVKRIFLHILIRHSWVEDEESMGKLVDVLFRWLTDDAQSIAVRAYSMVILENVSAVWPDLKREIVLVLEDTIPVWDSQGLLSVGRKMLKRLRKAPSVINRPDESRSSRK